MNFSLFSDFSEIKYGMSGKTDGPMPPSGSGLSQSLGRQSFFDRLNLGDWQIFNPLQSHSIKVVNFPSQQSLGDAAATKRKGVLLCVTVADCFPIYFFDPVSQTIAIAHSGWRGTAGNIAAETLTAMGADPKNIRVGIGPGIQLCHFEIKEDILARFLSWPDAIVKKGRQIYVDLPKIITSQLTAAGVPSPNIENTGSCTYCEDQAYYSFRRDKPAKVQAMVAYIGLS